MINANIHIRSHNQTGLTIIQLNLATQSKVLLCFPYKTQNQNNKHSQSWVDLLFHSSMTKITSVRLFREKYSHNEKPENCNSNSSQQNMLHPELNLTRWNDKYDTVLCFHIRLAPSGFQQKQNKTVLCLHLVNEEVIIARVSLHCSHLSGVCLTQKHYFLSEIKASVLFRPEQWEIFGGGEAWLGAWSDSDRSGLQQLVQTLGWPSGSVRQERKLLALQSAHMLCSVQTERTNKLKWQDKAVTFWSCLHSNGRFEAARRSMWPNSNQTKMSLEMWEKIRALLATNPQRETSTSPGPGVYKRFSTYVIMHR